MTFEPSSLTRTAVQTWTLIIPTFNRATRLRRALTFYAEQDVEGLRIIIADSSTPSIKQENSETVKTLNRRVNQITYLEFDESQNLFRKVRLALKHCETDYVATAADDDLLLVSRGQSYLHKLDSDPNLFSAAGMVAKLNCDENGHEKSWLIRSFPENNSKSISERILLQCNWLTTYFWSYYRTNQLYSLLDYIESVSPNQWDSTTEYFLYFLMVSSGEIKRANEISYIMVRHQDSETIRRLLEKKASPCLAKEQVEQVILDKKKLYLAEILRFGESQCGRSFPSGVINELERFFGLTDRVGGFARVLPTMTESPSKKNLKKYLFKLILPFLKRVNFLRISGLPILVNDASWLAFEDRRLLQEALGFIKKE